MDFSSHLDERKVDESLKRDLVALFEFTQYLFDDDKNLTKTLNLTKAAREQLEARIKDLFEGGLPGQLGAGHPGNKEV